MENNNLNLNINNSINNNRNNINPNENILLFPNRSHSTSDLFSYNKESKFSTDNNRQIYDERTLNEYYKNNLYNNNHNSERNFINSNQGHIQNIFNDIPISPIDNINSPKIYDNDNNASYNNLRNDITSENYKNFNYRTIDNNNYYYANNNNPNNDLLIEFNNKKRLKELRNKYLCNTSNQFLKMKDNISQNNNKINNDFNINNYESNNNKNDNLNNCERNNIIQNNTLYNNYMYNVKNNNNNNNYNNYNQLNDLKMINYNNEDAKESSLLEDNNINKNLNYPYHIKKINENILNENDVLLLSEKDYNDKFNKEQIINIIMEIQNKYFNLQNEYNNLLNEKNKNSLKEKDIYKHYLIEQNNKLKTINDRYEIIINCLLSYINDINQYYNIKQIEYYHLKYNITNDIIDDNAKYNYINDLAEFLKTCRDKIIYNKGSLRDLIKLKREINKENNDNSQYINDKKNGNKKNKKRNLLSCRNINKINNTKDNSSVNIRNKFFNSSCDSINSTINKTTLMNKTKKYLNLFKRKKKSYKGKFWNENKLVSYSILD